MKPASFDEHVEAAELGKSAPIQIGVVTALAERAGAAFWPVAAALLGCAGLFGLHFGAFTGTRLIPYDAITDYYPWYVNALHSAREGLFVALNPFKLGGMTNIHLLAHYDPFYWRSEEHTSELQSR